VKIIFLKTNIIKYGNQSFLLNPIFVLSILIWIIPVNLIAQKFAMDIESTERLIGHSCKLVTINGDSIEGRLADIIYKKKIIKSIKIRDSIYNSSTINRLEIKASLFIKLSIISERSTSLSQLFKTNLPELRNKDYVIFEGVRLPGKKEKYALLQLINPGSFKKVKVYTDPKAKETMHLSRLSGGKDKSFYLSSHNGKVVKIKKNGYKKQFRELYNNCDKLMKVFYKGGDPIKYRDFVYHIYVFNNLCD